MPRDTACLRRTYEGQAGHWTKYWQSQYAQLLQEADEVVTLAQGYIPGCHRKRNRFMVDNTDALLAIYGGECTGSTAYAMEYAKRSGKEVVRINSETFVRSVISPVN